MKSLRYALALLAATAVTSAFAEGGADRLQEHHARWALQQQQSKDMVAKREAAKAAQQDAQVNSDSGQDTAAKPSS
ncbi:hypothetical protein [Pseudomonas sp. BNK-43-a]|uniref:hypothetical protein n=1 Tax=unclassified Pseudomonas TaxID=196821 RepID=UPI0039BFE968